MIIDITKPRSSFLDFILYQEKDESPRKNMKVIDLKVSDKRRQDFTKGAEIEGLEEEPEEITEDEPVIDDGDYTTGSDAEAEPPGDEPTDSPTDEPIQDETDYTTDNQTEEDIEQPDVDAQQEQDEPVIDDGDYTTGSDAEAEPPGDEPTDSPTDTDDTAGSENTDGETEDSPLDQLYKYNLYKKFQKVLKTIKEYSDDLDNIISDDFETNAKYRELTSKLKDIEELMQDYMIMKFSKTSFMQSMLFYQRVVTSVDIILQTLKYIRQKDVKSKI